MNKYCVYYRVSDVKQARSGLGLEAQQTAFLFFLKNHPGTVVGEFTEIETGKTYRKSQHRPELQKAIELAHMTGATLVIAKICRLARNVAFIAMLLESKLRIICCDIPEADHFTLQILAAVAEREGALISERTKAALEALKARGVPLGSARPGHWDGLTQAGVSRVKCREAGLVKAQTRSREIVQEEMSQRYEPLVPWIREMREAGLTLQQIVGNLNAKGCLTRYDRPWNLSTLRRVIEKYLGPNYLGQLNSKLHPVIAVGG